MALPDRWADEPLANVPDELWHRWCEYSKNAEEWQKLADQVRDEIQRIVGPATAVVVDGHKVATYRPENRYAVSTLRRDYPQITDMYMYDKTVPTFNMELFAKAHPEIAEKYRVRSFRALHDPVPVTDK